MKKTRNVVKLTESDMQKIVERSVNKLVKQKLTENLTEAQMNKLIQEGFFDGMRNLGRRYGNRANNAVNNAKQGAQNLGSRMASGARNLGNRVGAAAQNAVNRVQQGAQNVGNAVRNEYNTAKQVYKNGSVAGDLRKVQGVLDRYSSVLASQSNTRKGYNMMKNGLAQIIQALDANELNA